MDLNFFTKDGRYQDKYIIESTTHFFDGELAIARSGEQRFYLQFAPLKKQAPPRSIRQYLALDHPLAIPYLQVFTEERALVFIRPFIEIRPLLDVVIREPMDEDRVITWVKSLLQLEILLSKQPLSMYLLRDPQNFGLTSDGELKIIYCGVEQVTELESTLDWGTLLYTLLSGEVPDQPIAQLLEEMPISKPMERLLQRSSAKNRSANDILGLIDAYEKKKNSKSIFGRIFRTHSNAKVMKESQPKETQTNRVSDKKAEPPEKAKGHDQEGLERERLEAERLEAERLERERLEAERLEAERLERERLEAERLEAERLERERLEAERLEAERLERERLEAERLEAERLERERLEAERLEAERLERERLEAERLEAERLERERLEAERLEAERLEQRLEAERLEAERLERERLEAERLEAERLRGRALNGSGARQSAESENAWRRQERSVWSEKRDVWAERQSRAWRQSVWKRSAWSENTWRQSVWRQSGSRTSGGRASGGRAPGGRASGSGALGARTPEGRAFGSGASGARTPGGRASGSGALGARTPGGRAPRTGASRARTPGGRAFGSGASGARTPGGRARERERVQRNLLIRQRMQLEYEEHRAIGTTV